MESQPQNPDSGIILKTFTHGVQYGLKELIVSAELVIGVSKG